MRRQRFLAIGACQNRISRDNIAILEGWMIFESHISFAFSGSEKRGRLDAVQPQSAVLINLELPTKVLCHWPEAVSSRSARDYPELGIIELMPSSA